MIFPSIYICPNKHHIVIPAKAEIQLHYNYLFEKLNPSFRWGDGLFILLLLAINGKESRWNGGCRGLRYAQS